MSFDTPIVVLGSLILLLLPGALLARPFPLLWRRLTWGERFVPAFLLSAGYLSLIWALAQAWFPQLDSVAWVWGGGVLVLFALGLFRPVSQGAGPTLHPPGDSRATIWVLPILLLATIVMLIEGGSLGYIHDSLDFVSFIRRTVQTNQIDILTGSYANTEGMGPDPRRGAFHLGLALLSSLGRVDPIEIWRSLPVALVPLSLWIFYVSFRRLLESAGAAAFALLLLLSVHLFGPNHFFHNLAYASRFGWVYSWVGLWALGLFLDAERADRTPPLSWSPLLYPPGRKGRPGAAAAALAVFGAPILLGIHVLSALTYILGLAAFCWVWRFSKREPGPVQRWISLIPIASAVALAPALALKVMQSYSTANPIFDHPQGLLYLGGGFALLAPNHFIQWFGWVGLLGVILTLPMIPRATVRRDFAFFVGATVVAGLILLNPVAVWVIEKAGAHSVLFRVILLVPFFQVLGFYSIWAVRKWVERPSKTALILPTLFLGALAWGVVLEARQAIAFFAEPARRRAAWEESQPLQDALAFLDTEAPEPVVVFSDPITSYQIPAYSRHYAMAPFNQHSSPADPRACERMQDAHRVQSAFVPLDETLRTLAKYDASYLVENQSFPRYVKFYGTFVEPAAWPATRAKFAAVPDIFVPIYDESGVRIYEIHYPDEYPQHATENPSLVLTAAEAAGRTTEEIARDLGAHPLRFQPVDGLEPIGIFWDEGGFAVGDYIDIWMLWRRTGPPGELPVEAFFRAETVFPDDRIYHPLFGKPFRRIYERRNGETYRFGRWHGPLEGSFPLYLWEDGAIYIEKFELPIPDFAATGRYTMSMKMERVPFSPSFHLVDFFNVRDSFDGKPIGEVELFANPEDGSN